MVYLGGRQKSCIGSGMWDWADPNKNGVSNAFDPNKNGVANAFDPNKNGITSFATNAANQVANQAKNLVSPYTSQIENFGTKTLPSFLIHQGLPAVGEFAGSKLGLGQQGRDLANMGANELGKVTGLGLKRFKKGSPEAKAFMKSLRDRKRK